MSERYNNSQAFYSCYSTRIYEHLTKCGFETYRDDKIPEGRFVNIKTGKTCHVFKKNPELCRCVAEVSNPQN